MSQVDDLQSTLAQLEAAYDSLLRTGGVQRIREGTKWIEYHAPNLPALAARIADLKGQLRALGVAVSGGRIRSRRVYFG